MKKMIFAIVVLAAASVSPLHAQANSTVSGSVAILGNKGNKQISSARVGQTIRLRVTAKDLHLLANREAELTYGLSVLPTGSNTPVEISGKLAGLVTLPASEGGAKKTREEMASLKGTQQETFFVTIPDFMPVGRATLTVSLSGKNVGGFKSSKRLTIRL